MKVSSLSTETVLIPVSEVVSGFVIDMTGYPVEIAFVADTADPSSGDWNPAVWETSIVSGEHDATIVVGPTGVVTLAKGGWRPWVRVSTPTEVPVLKCPGMLRIF